MPHIGNICQPRLVKFDLDVTPQGGQRMQMSEVALYTTKDGKIVQEEFLYQS